MGCFCAAKYYIVHYVIHAHTPSRARPRHTHTHAVAHTVANTQQLSRNREQSSGTFSHRVRTGVRESVRLTVTMHFTNRFGCGRVPFRAFPRLFRGKFFLPPAGPTGNQNYQIRKISLISVSFLPLPPFECVLCDTISHTVTAVTGSKLGVTNQKRVIKALSC